MLSLLFVNTFGRVVPRLPATVQALALSACDGLGALSLVEKPLPEAELGQVLVKVAAAVNPSDLMFIRGRYGFTKALPTVPGFEASVESFWLSDYLGRLSLPGLLSRAVRVQRALATDLQVKVRARVGLEDAAQVIGDYQARVSDGKVLLTP